MLRNAIVNCIMDQTIGHFPEQIDKVGPAIQRAIFSLSNIQTTVTQLAVGRVDKRNAGSRLKHKVSIPRKTTRLDTYLAGSDVGLALLNPGFKPLIDKFVAELDGRPSAVLVCDVPIATALAKTPPGLIVGPPDADPVIALEFILISQGEIDIYNIVPTINFDPSITGSINWTETAQEDDFEGEDAISVLNEFTGPEGVDDPMVGDWTYTTTKVLVDDAGANPETHVNIFDTKLGTFDYKIDGADIFNAASTGPLTLMRDHYQIVEIDEVVNLAVTNLVANLKTGSLSSIQTVDQTTAIRKFQSITNKLEVINNTSETINAGVPVGQILVIEESIFIDLI